MRSFEEYFKPVYYLAKFTGIFHFDIYRTKRAKISAKIAENLWSLPIVITSFAVSVFGMKHFSKSIASATTKTVFRSRGLILLTFCTIKFVLDFIWYVIRRNAIKRALGEINKLSNETRFDFSRPIKRQVIATLAVTMGLNLTFVALNIIFGFKFVKVGCTNEITLIALTNYVIYCITRSIRDQFASLNSQLNKLKYRPNSQFEETILKIRRCTDVHFKLTKIAQQLNEAFSFPILGNTLILFILVTVFTYLLIFKASRVDEFEIKHVYTMLQDLYWVVFVASQYFLMVYSWDSVAKEANQTGLYIHKILNTFEDNQQISSIKEEDIDNISLQLLQNKLKFTVCRFVDLDWSLIHLVIQTVTMYLVWIIQLKT